MDVANVTSGHDEQCSQPESKRWLLVRPKIPPDGILPVEWTHILVDGILNWDVLPDMTHQYTSHNLVGGHYFCIRDVAMSNILKG